MDFGNFLETNRVSLGDGHFSAFRISQFSPLGSGAMHANFDGIRALNWKRLAFSPWEKLIFGVSAAVILLCLSVTHWATYQKTPTELSEAAKRVEMDLRNRDWPPSERNRLTETNVEERVRKQLFVKINPAAYYYGTPMSTPLYAIIDPVREPAWLPVDDVIATPGRFILKQAKPADETHPIRGVRYVAVRGIVPLREQGREMMHALRLDRNAAMLLPEYLDFTIERQTAIAGADPWAGAWTTLDIRTAFDLLDEAAAIAPDVVPDEFRNEVVTMPLPIRLDGEWGAQVSHSRFPLKPKQPVAPQEPPQRPARQRPGMPPPVIPVVQFDAESLLFRYIDFAVEPGACYRYRVKLTLRNPNHNRPRNEVRDESIALGETRTTPSSAATAPAALEDDVKYFLARSSRARGSARDDAQFSLFQWEPEFGTTVNAVLKTIVGQYIGGKTKTRRLNVAKPSFDPEEVTFTSRDLLVDSLRPPAFHALDRFDGDFSFKQLKELTDGGVFDGALVADRYGDLVVLDRLSTAAELRRAERRLEAERDPWLRAMTP